MDIGSSFQSRTMSLRRCDLIAIVMGKLQNTQMRKRCIKRHFQGIHHLVVNDPEFRASQLEHDRDEEVCFKKDELAQKRFQPSCDTKNLENDNSGHCHSGSISIGTNHRVLPPVGGNGSIPGGAHNTMPRETYSNDFGGFGN